VINIFAVTLSFILSHLNENKASFSSTVLNRDYVYLSMHVDKGNYAKNKTKNTAI
jgi:hypothetical protein